MIMIFKKHEATIKAALKDFVNIGLPVISDGEQTKSSFVTYLLEGLQYLAQEGMKINFEYWHSRQLPFLTKVHLSAAIMQKKLAIHRHTCKRSVISVSALSLYIRQKELRGIHNLNLLKIC